jgi:DNA-binding transcriptional LysR family regulator
VLADLLHFGRAAAALHLSQSALSVRIRNLEASLEATLFERDRRSVSLTVAGQVFLEDVHRLLRELEDAQRRAQRAAKGELGLIRIGFVSAAAVRIIPRIIRYYRGESKRTGDQEKPGARLDCFCFGLHGGMPP